MRFGVLACLNSEFELIKAPPLVLLLVQDKKQVEHRISRIPYYTSQSSQSIAVVSMYIYIRICNYTRLLLLSLALSRSLSFFLSSLSSTLYVYVCIYIYIFACMHTNIHACTHAYIHTYMHTHTYTHVYMYIYKIIVRPSLSRSLPPPISTQTHTCI